ncbi:MAG: hypothetical protein Q4F49_08225 [Pseudoxanthomonas suwonensis]|nr:hypothetical protein [Pseudoxanthomonas suwonensis]
MRPAHLSLALLLTTTAVPALALDPVAVGTDTPRTPINQAELQQALRDLPEAMREAMSELPRAMRQMQPAMQAMARELPLLMAEMAPLLEDMARQMEPALRNLQPQLERIGEDLRRADAGMEQALKSELESADAD